MSYDLKRGHRGMAGSAIVRRLKSEDCECLTAASSELDLRRQADVEAWVAANEPDAVFIAAGRVGGIVANDTQPVDFLLPLGRHGIEAREVPPAPPVDEYVYLGQEYRTHRKRFQRRLLPALFGRRARQLAGVMPICAV